MTRFLLVGVAIVAMASACGDDGGAAADAAAGDIDASAIDAGLCATPCENGTCVAANTCECDAGWQGDTCADLLPALAGANLLLWLDGDDVLGNGTAVTGTVGAWVDKSGTATNFLQASGGASPAIATVNGRSVVRFDGDDFMTSSNYAGLTAVSGYTVIIVFSGGDNQNAVLGGSNVGDDGQGLYFETRTGQNFRGLHRMPFGEVGGDDVISTSAALSTTGLNRVVFNRIAPSGKVLGSVDLGLNGTNQPAPYAAADFDENLNLSLGRLSSFQAERYLTGDIAEILIYGPPTTLPEVTAPAEAVAYLQAKWGVP